MNYPHNLNRFLTAQEGAYEAALREVRDGRKLSHWMWFVFPQIVGLGRTATSQTYAIKSREEAVAYLGHPVLGERLREISKALLSVNGKTAHEIFGTPDDLKLRSSMTLFKSVSADNDVFLRVLEQYYGGEEDPQTVRILGEMPEKSPSRD